MVEEFNLLENAFEDQQEQNMRLQQQLKEKDDANFKLLSEKIKVGIFSETEVLRLFTF